MTWQALCFAAALVAMTAVNVWQWFDIDYWRDMFSETDHHLDHAIEDICAADETIALMESEIVALRAEIVRLERLTTY